jgi:MarR family transcriptional regulator, organic hydroperoxide resistance regulator
MKKEKTIDFHIKWAWHAITRMYNAFAAREEFSMAIGYVLLNIDVENGTPATKIGPSIGMEPRSLTRMLKSLEEKGWIRKETDATDKRFVKIYLTEIGKAKRIFAREGVIKFNSIIREKIPAEKLTVFMEVIKEINHLVETESIKYKEENALLFEMEEE